MAKAKRIKAAKASQSSPKVPQFSPQPQGEDFKPIAEMVVPKAFKVQAWFEGVEVDGVIKRLGVEYDEATAGKYVRPMLTAINNYTGLYKSASDLVAALNAVNTVPPSEEELKAVAEAQATLMQTLLKAKAGAL